MEVVRTIFRGGCLPLCIIFILLSPIAANGEQRSSEAQQKAQRLWEQAIAARGGREQLYRANSLVISYQETVRNFLGIAVHRGRVEQLYVFPNRTWGWDDGLPPPFRLTVRMLDIERDFACTMYAGVSSPICGGARALFSASRERIDQVQYLYLMETRWVRPAPVSVRRDSIGLRAVDVLRTELGNKQIDYYLDRETHLPRRVAIYYNNDTRPTLTLDFSDYINIGGIQMPSKQKNGRISFQINPAFNESIFTHPPSIEAGPEAWRVSSAVIPPRPQSNF